MSLPAPTAPCMCLCFFFFNYTATTEIYTLSLHDALPIWNLSRPTQLGPAIHDQALSQEPARSDRKSTRLKSSHLVISYAAFSFKKKKKNGQRQPSSIRLTTLCHSVETTPTP